jgi:hypothetical protein
VFARLGDQTFGWGHCHILIAIEERANDVRLRVMVRIGMESRWWYGARNISCRLVLASASTSGMWAQFTCIERFAIGVVA